MHCRCSINNNTKDEPVHFNNLRNEYCYCNFVYLFFLHIFKTERKKISNRMRFAFQFTYYIIQLVFVWMSARDNNNKNNTEIYYYV